MILDYLAIFVYNLTRYFAILAQLVEQRFCKPSVIGSSPMDGSIN